MPADAGMGPPTALIVVVGGGCAVVCAVRSVAGSAEEGAPRPQCLGDGASQTRLIETSR
jgi:hypothetical protein